MILVVACTLVAGLVTANAAIPFLTTEAGYALFLIGGAAGFVGSIAYLVVRGVRGR